MATFLDAKGQTWPLTFNVNTIRRLREAGLGNFADPLKGDPPPLARLLQDVEYLVNVIYVACKRTADERGLDDEQFAEVLAGEGIGGAAEALHAALADFFEAARQPHVAKVVRKQLTLAQRTMELAEKKVDAFDLEALATQIEAQIEREMQAGIERATATLNETGG